MSALDAGPAGADRNLLFGILALQLDFINRDALIQAMNAWVLEKAKPLGQILQEQGALAADAHALLEALVQKHLALHGDDAEKSLAAVSSVSSVREELKQIADPDVQASVAHIAQARQDGGDSWATRAPSVGTCTSSGQRFRILRPHARGGLGQVSVARDEELNREVAFKEIQNRFADDPNSRLRFVQEAEITGGLEHPGIVPVYGLGQYADGRPFYAMRFIRGDSLQDAIAQFHQADVPGRDPGERTLALRQLLGRFLDVCNAMGYAHSRGVLHRDLKPGNIMLGKYGETLVVDWGLAKPVDAARGAAAAGEETPLRPASGSGSGETLSGSALGTPAYMSPEQAAGRLELLGPASDVYSLGATLYCLLAGKPPFGGADVGVTLQRVQRGEFPAPRQVKPGVPPALEAICLKAMALRPVARYPSARALANDVEHWLADEPVSAWPEPWTVRARRWAGKHRSLIAGSATALVVAVVGLLAATLLLTEANHRVENALTAEQQAKQTAQAREAETRVAKIRAETALTAEKHAKQAAVERGAETAAVLNFVEQKIFAAARPAGQEGGLGRDVTLRRAIAAAVPFVNSSFRKQPLIEAHLRMTLGISLLDLGEAGLAAEHFQKARMLYTKFLGPDDPATLASMNNLANSYAAVGRQADALKLREQTLALEKAKLGPDHPATLVSMNNLANSYAAVGRQADALNLYEKTLAVRKAKLGPDHPDTLTSMNNLAESYYALGRYAEALKLHEETLALEKAKLGPDHPDTLRTMGNLATCYAAVGRQADALKLYEKTLVLRKAKLGPDHPDTLTSMNGVANSYDSLGRHSEALKLREETLALEKAKLGPDHPATLMSMDNLANCYAAVGRQADALKLREETLALRKAKLGPDHPDTLTTMGNLANSYDTLGRHSEALKLREETLALRKAKLGPDHPATLTSMNNLAESYYALGRYAEALKLHEETLALEKAKLGPDHPDTLRTMGNLANSYYALGRYAEALKLYEETQALEKAKLGPDHPDTLITMSNLANSYAAVGRQADALKLHEETLALRKGKLGPDHPATLASMNNLANSYAAVGRQADALKLREETLALRKAKLGPDHPDTLTSMNNLAVSYAALGRQADALKLREETLALRKAKLGPYHPDTLKSMNGVASSYFALGRYAEALNLWEETLALEKAKLGPDHPDTLRTMGMVAACLFRLDRGAEAIPISNEFMRRATGKGTNRLMMFPALTDRLLYFEKAQDAVGCRVTAEMWEKQKRTDAGSLFYAARMRAVTAAVLRASHKFAIAAKEADAEADRAMVWLKQAVTAGYHNVAQLKQDTNLAVLRDREDFKSLLATLQAAQTTTKSDHRQASR